MAEYVYGKQRQQNASATPAPTPEPETPVEEPEEEQADVSLTVGEHAVDIMRGLVGGARDSIQETIDTGLMGMETISGKVDELTGGRPEVTREAYAGLKKRMTFSEVEANKGNLGSITRSVTKFALGFVGAGKVLRVSKGFSALAATEGITKTAIGSRLAAQGVQGLVGDFIVSDPHEERLADLAADVPIVGEAIDNFLGADENDSAAVGKLKSALEGLIVGSLIGGVVEGAIAIKSARKLRKGKVKETIDGGGDAPDILESGSVADIEARVKAMYEEATPRIVKPFEKAGKEGLEVSHTVGGKYNIESAVEWNGHRLDDMLEANPNSTVIVAKDAHGNEVGSLWFDTAPEGGFNVRDIRTKGKGTGAARELYYEARRITGGPRRGGTEVTDQGKGMIARLKETDPDLFNEDTAASITKRMSKADHEIFQESLRRHITHGTDLDLPLQGETNWMKYDSPDSVLQLMDDLVITTRDGLKHIGGIYKPSKVKTLEMTKDLAKIMGKDSSELYVSLHQTAKAVEDLDSRLIAGKMLVRKVSTDLDALAKKIENLDGTDLDKGTFIRMSEVLVTALDNVAAIRTAGARTTRAGGMQITSSADRHSVAKLLEKVGGDEYVKTLAARIRMADGDPAGVVAAVKGTPGKIEKITSVHNYIWMNGLLSGLKTTGVNLSSNLIQTVLMPAYRMAGGAMMRDKDQIAEGFYQYQALRSTLFDSWAYAKKAWSSNSAILDPGNGSAEVLQRMKNPLNEEYLGSWVKKANEQVESVTTIKQGIDWLGTIIGAPGRFLNMQDEFFKQINYRAHVVASARRDAFKKGIKDAALVQEYIDTSVANSIGHMGQALDDPALLAAQQATFTQSLKAESWFHHQDGTQFRSITETIAQLSQHPLIKGTVLPFIKVPANLMRMAWDMTPGLNMLRKQYYADVAAGGERAAMAHGKMGVGSMLWGSAALLAYEERITGGGPADPELRRQLGPDWQPYSFVFNNADGTKSYLNYARLDPFGVFFGLAADFAEIGGKVDAEHLDEIALKLSLGIVKNISSKTYLRGLIDVLNVFNGDEPKVQALIRSRLASYVPSIMQVVNSDDELKDMRNVMDGVRSRIPGLSTSVESKRDNFGEKVQPAMGYPWNAINPFTFHTSTTDPVRKELADLARTDSEVQFSLPRPILGTKEHGLDLREMKDPKTGQSAYDRWLELLSATSLHAEMLELIQSDQYKADKATMGDGSKLYKGSLAVEQVQDLFGLHERDAFQSLLDERPELREAIQTMKEGQRAARVDGPSAGTPLDALREMAGQR